MGINLLFKHKMDKANFVVLTLMLLLFTSPINANQIRSGVVEQSLGRDFGILVGDIIEHYYVVQVPADYTLTPASLPPNGELNYWLEQ